MWVQMITELFNYDLARQVTIQQPSSCSSCVQETFSTECQDMPGRAWQPALAPNSLFAFACHLAAESGQLMVSRLGIHPAQQAGDWINDATVPGWKPGNPTFKGNNNIITIPVCCRFPNITNWNHGFQMADESQHVAAMCRSSWPQPQRLHWGPADFLKPAPFEKELNSLVA